MGGASGRLDGCAVRGPSGRGSALEPRGPAVCEREGASCREAVSCRRQDGECGRAALLLPVVIGAVHAERRVAIDAVGLGE